jgi:protein O-GlcNAc transferase
MTIAQAFDLALLRHREGRLAEAEALYRQILAVQPYHADALHLLGVTAHQSGRHDIAVDWIRKAIALNPNFPAAHFNMGEACRAMGRLDEALAAYRRALQLKPAHAPTLYHLGNALNDLEQFDEAAAAYGRALELTPDHPDAHINLGIARAGQGKFDEAAACYRRGLELKPDCPEAHNNLANALKERGQLDEAIACYRRALELKPDYPEAHNNLGNALRDRGQIDEAAAAYRRALELKPEHAGMRSNLIYTLHFQTGHQTGTIAEERQRWNRQFAEPLKRFVLPHANDRNPERPLRIGYVSPDFREHVVGRNLIPLFQCHDRRDFEILCYSGVARPDEITEVFRRHSKQWRGTVGVADEALAEWIRQDAVDILVDLTQHMAGNRLPVFARQPAPIQVSFAGYPESAGLKAIGHRISDRYLETGFAGEGTERKERVHLIDSFWCYDPCEAKVEVNGLPARENGGVTFGCLNNFCKVNEPLLRLWARVLGKVAHSRLVLLSGVGSHRQRAIEALERDGVEPRRVEFVEYRPRREYLELYHRLDIILDTFPYNGHTMSLDALWMGVPVVSLAGDTPVSRAGLSQLTNVGLPELVAHLEDDYVKIAVELAGDFARLMELRSTLRDRMRASILMDPPRFARQVEQAYRVMWQEWVIGQTSGRE